MDEPLAKAYADLESRSKRRSKSIEETIPDQHGPECIARLSGSALRFGDLIGTEYDPELHRRVPFLIAQTQDLSET